MEALETYLITGVNVPLIPGAEESGLPLYWGVNPLETAGSVSLLPPNPLLTIGKRRSRSRRPFP